MVRINSKLLNLLIATVLLVSAHGMSTPVFADPERTGARTIIESLDDVVDKKTGRVATADAAPKAYDFSVTRELLPPIDDVTGADQSPGWEVVVQAQDIKTGSLATPAPEPGGTTLVIIFSIVALTSLALFLRQYHPHLASAWVTSRFSRLIPNIDLSAAVRRVSGALPFVSGARRSPKETRSEPDHQIEMAAADLAKRLTEIERIVSHLKDGSPLRDVLNQELRLIHYRISAATDAARTGQTPPERSAARFHGLVREMERVRRFADGAAASVIDPQDHLALPSTPSEAYALLGVNEDAPIATVKKLVDALRVTWHPDHARNESDRILREERIKQINSAWDLINPNVRRSAASSQHAWS